MKEWWGRVDVGERRNEWLGKPRNRKIQRKEVIYPLSTWSPYFGHGKSWIGTDILNYKNNVVKNSITTSSQRIVKCC